ncbi:hypothetical protein ACSDR0_42800 [Streptosporangium sp. G11]|uniref:hypothetical protein n=1 Tax=Streptosporangium sp. G11 TaxID=3436926 RepID=UPI003EBE1C0E
MNEETARQVTSHTRPYGGKVIAAADTQRQRFEIAADLTGANLTDAVGLPA